MSMIAIVDAVTGALEQLVASADGCDMAGRVAVTVDHLPDMAREYWDATARAFVIDLDKLRAARWVEARAYRDRKRVGGAVTPLGRVDSDEESRGLILGARELAKDALAAGVPFLMAWTMADNNDVDHDAEALLAMSAAVGLHIAACHAAGQSIRAAIDAATSVEAIAAVDIEAGYPA